MEKHNITTFVCHPLAFARVDSPRMRRYLERLALMQERYNVKVCIENMKNENAYRLLFSEGKSMNAHLRDIGYIADAYGISVNFDTSHARFARPQNEQVFRELLPKIGNIHLSSFHGKREHLPLTMGDFDTPGFVSYLAKNNYTGLLTFEIYYPKMVSLRAYDFSAIRDSVAMIKDVAGKL